MSSLVHEGVTSMKLTPQQQGVIDWVKNGSGNAFVTAVAGAGKTTTLLKAASVARGNVSIVAFNNKIVREIEGKVAKMGLGNRVRVMTFHSAGFRAWRYRHKDVTLDAKKKRDLLTEICGVHPLLSSFVFKLVGFAKMRAVGIAEDEKLLETWTAIVDRYDLENELDIEADEDQDFADEQDMLLKGIATAQKVLEAGRRIATKVIDFDDMIYMAIYDKTCQPFQVDWVFVDEAQDSSPARRLLAKKMLKPGGRALWVGDERQAIYAFAGADTDAVEQIRRDFKTTDLPLTVTFRCPKTVVAEAQKIVSHIEAHESAPDGIVREAEYKDILTEKLGADDFILCRVTKPLVKLAFQLIARGTPCYIEGRDFGDGLKKIVQQLQGRSKKAISVGYFLERLDNWEQRGVSKAREADQGARAQTIEDQAECLRVIAQGCPDTDCIVKKIDSLFKDANGELKPMTCLSTIHRAKGREADRVFFLGRERYCPSPWAKTEEDLIAEANIEYVGITRAMRELVFVSMLGT